MNVSHGPTRTLLWCFCGIAILLILTASFLHTREVLLRGRPDSPLAEMQSAALHRTEMAVQVSQPIDPGAERVVDQYLTLVGNGALLTPSGWKEAEKLSYESGEFSSEAPILLMLTIPGGVSGRWTKEGQLELYAYGGDDVGSIDSTFLYRPSKGPRASKTGYIFRPLFTDRHTETRRDGTKTQEAAGAKEWKVDGPVGRFATVQSVIPYLIEKRRQTNDAETKSNIEKTISILKRLAKRHVNACAC